MPAIARASVKGHGSLPTLSVWHGTRDSIVDPVNADWIVDQWRDLHALGAAPGTVENIGRHLRETWSDDRGRAVVERYHIAGMGHGTPLDTRGGEVCGVAGPHMLEAGICSTSRIAAFWGIADSIASPRPAQQVRHTPHPASRPANSIETIIEDALRSAGLMR